MAERKPYMVGNVRLSDLNGFEDTVKGGVRGCFIPYDQNPSLYLGVNRQTGLLTLDVDILVRETAASKTGATHFIKLNVGKANRERFQLGQDALDSLKIVGNLYTRTPAPAGRAQGVQGAAPAPQGGYRQHPPRQAPAYGEAPQGGFQAPAPQYGAQGRPGGYPGGQADFSAQGAGW